MKKIVMSYVVPYLISMALTFAFWMMTIWTQDGWPVVVTTIFFFGLMFLMIPVMLWMDYKAAHKFIMTQVVLHKDEERRHEAYANVASKAAEHCGVPGFICEWATKAIVAQVERTFYKSTQPKELLNGRF